MTKDEIRLTMRDRLRQLNKHIRRTRDQQICQAAIAAIDWSSVNRLCSYRAHPSLQEVDPSSIIEFVNERHSSITIDIVESSSGARIPSERYDVVLVPLVAFDDALHRLGRGGGWYDRFLENQSDAIKIGLAYNEQRFGSVPTEPHDIHLDNIFSA